MPIPAETLQKAIGLYLQLAYPASPPPDAVRQRIQPILDLPSASRVPENLLDRETTPGSGGNAIYVLRLGQPLYPFMKLVLDPAPSPDPAAPRQYLLRVDAHDRHLHAAPNSPDAAWLATVRASNQSLVEKIESAWSHAGLPTFKEFLRQQLQARKAQKSADPDTC